MKTRSFLIYSLCALLYSCNLVDAQVVWLSAKNPDFTNCDVEERDVRPFDGVVNTCPFDVYYEQSDVQYVIVEGDEEYFDRLHTDVKRGVLEISIEPARYRNVRLRVRVGSPEITLLSMAGSGSIICKSNIVTDDDLSLRMAGSGDLVTANITCDNLQSSLTGSGDLKLGRVEAEDVDVNVSGSGDWGASRIKADNLEISLAGSGDVDIVNVDIDDNLSASVAGSGDIRVSGHAHNVTAKVAGSGDISGRISYDHITKVKVGSGDIDW
ncbi:MAG: DUF2807 domain-containing protein [Bacteroidaceae bacterium]|nr:DUF2807 domain-containing protein [Bacteroidaceae bacterium]